MGGSYEKIDLETVRYKRYRQILKPSMDSSEVGSSVKHNRFHIGVSLQSQCTHLYYSSLRLNSTSA